jgi:hypothetical protein
MRCPPLQAEDFVILCPSRVAVVEEPDVPRGPFLLVRVVSCQKNSHTFEPIESGPLALVEAMGLLLVRSDRRLWWPPGFGRRASSETGHGWESAP